MISQRLKSLYRRDLIHASRAFFTQAKRRCEITIISFSRSICRGGLAALIGVTGKPYPSCLSCHSLPIRPYGAPSPRGEGCDTRIPSSKKGGEAATRALNPEPNESKVKRGCKEMRIHFFTAPFPFTNDQRSTLHIFFATTQRSYSSSVT